MVNPQQCAPPSYLVRRASGVSLAAAVAGALIYVSLGQGSGLLSQFVAALFYSVSIATPSALLLNYFSHKALAKRPWIGKFIALGVLVGTSIFGTLVALLLMTLVGMNTLHEYWARFVNVIGISTIITITFGFSTFLYESVRRPLEQARLELHTREMEQERALTLLAEARLSSLESRIHPHFLFNTLNSIASLIPTDPARAEAMVGKLASLLRFSLNASQTGLVPLEQELRIVRDYLEIEKARFGPRLNFAIEMPPGLGAAGVPPLSVESLVENSIKHVIAQKPGGGDVRVTADATDGKVWVEVADTGPGFSLEMAPAGHGLDNLAARLKLLFGGDANLAVSQVDGHSAVRMSVPRKSSDI